MIGRDAVSVDDAGMKGAAAVAIELQSTTTDANLVVLIQ